MDLLKTKVDNNVKSLMIFPNANWIIAYNTDVFINGFDNDGLNEPLKDIKDGLKDIKELNIKELNIKEPLKDIKELNIKESLNDIKELDIKEPLKDIKEPIKESLNDIKKPLNDIQTALTNVKESTQDKIIEVNTITPLDFIKNHLQLYEDNETIKNKLFTFISNQKVITKYTKRGTSLIMDGLSQNKWNVNVCKLFSFLLDVTFKYRKQLIKK